MGKAKKLKISKREAPAPLEDQINSGNFAAPTGRVKERQRLEEDENFVESRLSKSIITQARKQVIILTTIFHGLVSGLVQFPPRVTSVEEHRPSPTPRCSSVFDKLGMGEVGAGTELCWALS